MPKGGNAKFHITDNQVLNVKNALNNQGNTKVNTVSSRDFQKLVKEAIKKSKLERGKAPQGFQRKLSTTQLKRLKKKYWFKSTKNAQTITKARDREEYSLRNWLAEAAMLQAFCSDTPLPCRINMDATQYRVTKDGIVTTVFYDADRDTYCDPITRKEIPDDDIGLGIKVYNQIASNGAAAPLVFHVADENLPKDEFRVHKLMSCGHDCNPNSFSWLVTTHSRSGNDAFYDWFILNSMLPFVHDCRKASGMNNPNVFYSMDRE